MVNKKRLIKLTRRLIQLNSENPPGDESGIAGFVKGYLDKLGLKTKIYAFQKKRSNVVVVLGSRGKKHSLLITPHLDTVPAGQSWHFHPFRGRIHKGRIYGLGATDCKANVGCSLEVINSLIEDKVVLGYNLIFAATADEETGSTLGLIPLLDKGILKPDAALVLDSDDFDIIITQKGLMHLKVKLQGRKAHGAYPWLGINAIDIAVAILRDLKNYRFSSSQGRLNKYLKAPTLNIGTIQGGDKVNVVADWCEFELDYRFLPGHSPKNILREIRSIILRHTRKFKIETQWIQKPYRINKNHPLVYYLARAMRKAGLEPVIKGSEGATTLSFFQNKNIPAVATGFGSGGCAHISDEYVKIDNLYKGARVLEEFLKIYKFN